MPLKVSGIDNLVTVTGSQQATDAHIQSNRFVALWEMLNIRVVYQQRDMPTSTGVEFDRNGRRLAPGRQCATPTNRQRLHALRYRQRPILPPESSLCELSTSSVVPFFKVGVFRHTTEKVAERMREDAAVLAAAVHC